MDVRESRREGLGLVPGGSEMTNGSADVMQEDGENSGSTPLFHGAQNHCFGCGTANEVGLRLKFSVTETEESLSTVIADATISDLYEGPPGYLHGGIIATLLDEAMSKANRAQGVTAMTRQMAVEYLRPVPSGAPIRIEGHVTRVEGRKHWAEAKIANADGVLLASATALFIAIRDR